MSIRSTLGLCALSLVALTMGTGCAGATINPGHRGILFDPGQSGVQPEVLKPGWVTLTCPFWEPQGQCKRVDDYDVTYQTSQEQFHVLSKEGLPMDVQIAVSYRPIVSELYLLDTEIGPKYFDKVIGPEFRNASIGVFSTESYQDLQRLNGDIESKIEKRLRERLQGKHLEVSSVFIQHVSYDTAILQQQQQEVVSRQQLETSKQLESNKYEQEKQTLQLQTETKELEIDAQKKLLAAETEKKKLELQAEADQKKLEGNTQLELAKLEAQQQSEAEKVKIDSELRNKQAEKTITLAQAQIDKMKADAAAASQVAQAKGESTSRLLLAQATEAEARATAAQVSPMQVEEHAYDALGKLGGTGTTILLGDPAKLPGWLFPKVPGFQSAFNPTYLVPALPASPAAPAAAAGAALSQADGNPYRGQ
jgi:regulator of protease activity HflC (stomatin/prohibitin superfamily)